MIHIGPRPHHATEAQIGLDQRGHRHHRRTPVNLVLGHLVHILRMGRHGAHAQGLGRKMPVVQQRQGLGQGPHIRAMKGRHAKHDLDPVARHVFGQPGPKMKHRRPAPVIGMHTRPPQFQQGPARGPQGAQVILVLGIKLTRRLGLLRAQHAVNANHPPHRIIKKQHMVKKRVKAILLKPRLRIDQRAAAAQFTHKDVIAQCLGRPQISVTLCHGDTEFWGGRVRHGRGCTAAQAKR
mmetsp:Transcript_27655/g.51358  ORF Transcript_27655/g.51358 Transcript_27655/m.51358 type:complete len:237 (+) Transcript_27655:568-1278(+)